MWLHMAPSTVDELPWTAPKTRQIRRKLRWWIRPRGRCRAHAPRGLSFHLLGRLQAYDDDVELDLGSRKQRAVLALLLLNANRVVSTERLIDELWGDSPPSTARATLQVYVAGLRKALSDGGASLRTRAPGYVLEVDAGALDLDRFTQLRAEAREAPDAERRAGLMHEALMLWRDAPLPELRTEPFSTAAVAQLEQLRLAALEERIDADLALGREPALVTELESLIAEHPYRERLRAQLMLALYRSGRQADALDAYQAGRRVLQEDLGLEPGKELRDSRLRSCARTRLSRPLVQLLRRSPSSRRRHAASRDAQSSPRASAESRRSLWGGVTAFRSRASGGAHVQPLSVGVVDPVARRVVDDIPVEVQLGADRRRWGAVWLLDPNGSTLTKIDPETNDVVSRFGIQRPGVPTGLAAGEGSVWISSSRAAFSACSSSARNLANCVDAFLAAERARVPGELRIGPTDGRRGRRLGARAGLGQVTRIQPATGRHERFAEGGAMSSIAVDANAVWLGGTSGVTKVDLDTGRTLESTTPTPVLESVITSIDVGPDAVWFVGDSSKQLWRIDPLRVSILATVQIGAMPRAVAVGDDGPCGSRATRRRRSGGWIPRRTSPILSTSERPRERRRPLRQDLDEPWSISW